MVNSILCAFCHNEKSEGGEARKMETKWSLAGDGKLFHHCAPSLSLSHPCDVQVFQEMSDTIKDLLEEKASSRKL